MLWCCMSTASQLSIWCTIRFTSARSKKYRFIRDRVNQEKEIEIRKVNIDGMEADMLTNNASVIVVQHNKKLIFFIDVFYPHLALGGCIDF